MTSKAATCEFRNLISCFAEVAALPGIGKIALPVARSRNGMDTLPTRRQAIPCNLDAPSDKHLICRAGITTGQGRNLPTAVVNSQQDLFVSFQGNAVSFASFQSALLGHSINS